MHSRAGDDMDPMTVLLTALSVGAAFLKPAADQVVVDAYTALRDQLARRLGRQARDLDSDFGHLSTNLGAQNRTRSALARAQADRDQQLLDLATSLLRRAEHVSPGISGGLVGAINAQGGRVYVAHASGGGIVTGPGHRGNITVYGPPPAPPTLRHVPAWVKVLIVLGVALAIVGFGMVGYSIVTFWGTIGSIRPGGPPPTFPPPGAVPGMAIFFCGLVVLIVAGLGVAFSSGSKN